MFDATARAAIARTARGLGVEPAALLAVAEVESGGRAHARVNGRDEPLIRFEGHYFHRLLNGGKRARAVREGLAAPRWGIIANPRSQAARWKLLERARAIDREAADQSVSWGLGQVMGANWRPLGYGSVHELVAEARSGTGGQVAVMARFIRANGLTGALRKRDWRAFARAYNGPAFAKNAYDRKMARAYGRWAGVAIDGAIDIANDDPPPVRPASPSDDPSDGPSASRTDSHAVLRRGARGEAVVALQEALGVAADGRFGPVTESALRRFQRARGLAVDGAAGPRTWSALERSMQRRRMRRALARLIAAPFRVPFTALRRLMSRLLRRLPARPVR